MVLGLLWGSSVYSKIDAEKIKTIKCKLESVGFEDEKYEGEDLKKAYKEGFKKNQTFKLKKNYIKSQSYKNFSNMFIKNNIITGSDIVEKEVKAYGQTMNNKIEKSITIDLNKMSVEITNHLFVGQDGKLEELMPKTYVNYSSCIVK